MSEWISVTDSLPEDYGYYLTFSNGNITPPNQRVRVLAWTGDRVEDYWRGIEAGSRITGITHWMPLPEDPKEVSGAG